MKPIEGYKLNFYMWYQKPKDAVYVTVRKRKVLFWDKHPQEIRTGLSEPLEDTVRKIMVCGSDYTKHVRYHGISKV